MVPLGGGLGGGGLGGGGFGGGGFGGGNWGGNGGPPNWSWAPTRWQTGKKKKKKHQLQLEYDEDDDDDDEDEESSEPRGAREKRRQRKIYQRRVDKQIKTRMPSCTFYIVQSDD